MMAAFHPASSLPAASSSSSSYPYPFIALNEVYDLNDSDLVSLLSDVVSHVLQIRDPSLFDYSERLVALIHRELRERSQWKSQQQSHIDSEHHSNLLQTEKHNHPHHHQTDSFQHQSQSQSPPLPSINKPQAAESFHSRPSHPSQDFRSGDSSDKEKNPSRSSSRSSNRQSSHKDKGGQFRSSIPLHILQRRREAVVDVAPPDSTPLTAPFSHHHAPSPPPRSNSALQRFHPPSDVSLSRTSGKEKKKKKLKKEKEKEKEKDKDKRILKKSNSTSNSTSKLSKEKRTGGGVRKKNERSEKAVEKTSETKLKLSTKEISRNAKEGKTANEKQKKQNESEEDESEESDDESQNDEEKDEDDDEIEGEMKSIGLQKIDVERKGIDTKENEPEPKITEEKEPEIESRPHSQLVQGSQHSTEIPTSFQMSDDEVDHQSPMSSEPDDDIADFSNPNSIPNPLSIDSFSNSRPIEMMNEPNANDYDNDQFNDDHFSDVDDADFKLLPLQINDTGLSRPRPQNPSLHPPSLQSLPQSTSKVTQQSQSQPISVGVIRQSHTNADDGTQDSHFQKRQASLPSLRAYLANSSSVDKPISLRAPSPSSPSLSPSVPVPPDPSQSRSKPLSAHNREREREDDKRDRPKIRAARDSKDREKEKEKLKRNRTNRPASSSKGNRPSTLTVLASLGLCQDDSLPYYIVAKLASKSLSSSTSSSSSSSSQPNYQNHSTPSRSADSGNKSEDFFLDPGVDYLSVYRSPDFIFSSLWDAPTSATGGVSLAIWIEQLHRFLTVRAITAEWDTRRSPAENSTGNSASSPSFSMSNVCILAPSMPDNTNGADDELNSKDDRNSSTSTSSSSLTSSSSTNPYPSFASVLRLIQSSSLHIRLLPSEIRILQHAYLLKSFRLAAVYNSNSFSTPTSTSTSTPLTLTLPPPRAPSRSSQDSENKTNSNQTANSNSLQTMRSISNADRLLERESESASARYFLVTREKEEVYQIVRHAFAILNEEQKPSGSQSRSASLLGLGPASSSTTGSGSRSGSWLECPIADLAMNDDGSLFIQRIESAPPLTKITMPSSTDQNPDNVDDDDFDPDADADADSTLPDAQGAGASGSDQRKRVSSATSSLGPPPFSLAAPNFAIYPSPALLAAPILPSNALSADSINPLQSVSSSTSISPFFSLGGIGGGRVSRPPLYWNLLWTWRSPFSSATFSLSLSSLLSFQRVNHFPDSRVLCRKDLLKRALERFTHHRSFRFANQFQIMPPTFILPNDYLPFVDAFAKAGIEERQQQQGGGGGGGNNGNFWILKPVSLSRGRGISLVNDLSTMSLGENQSAVVQKYIMNPFLLDGYKFDLRLYIVVTSFSPLECFFYDDGFARFATSPYSSDPAHIKNKFIHLTNSSIQKKQIDSNPLPSSLMDDVYQLDGGSKISLSSLKKKLAQKGINVNAVMDSIERLILKALIAVEDQVVSHVNCFELFGFDVLLDKDLRPWLLEVNASPSMGHDTPLDIAIKPNLIADIIRLVDPLPFDRAYLAQLLERRLVLGHWEASVPRSREEKKRIENILLTRILTGQRPRLYGEIPPKMGKFQRLAPGTAAFDQLMKMKRTAFQPVSNPVMAHKRTLPVLV